jgi:hypothetical protein
VGFGSLSAVRLDGLFSCLQGFTHLLCSTNEVECTYPTSNRCSPIETAEIFF